MVLLGAKKPPSRKGSMADMPRDLKEQIEKLEEQFVVSTEKLKHISDHFVAELEKGLSEQGGSIPMIPTWCMAFPDGNETGKYLALDMARYKPTWLRGYLTEEKGEFEIIQSKYPMGYVADCLQQFIEYHTRASSSPICPSVFTFSYPVSQDAIDHGVLQRWTKGFDVQGVEGVDVVPGFKAALEERGVPYQARGAGLVASSVTGCNAAYMEECGAIPKLKHMNLAPKLPMALSHCEWGAFDNEHQVLPRTKYDVIIDKESPRPGQQTFEKMVAGLYLGEIFRLVLLDLHKGSECSMFEGQNASKLDKPYSLDAGFLSQIEEDRFENLQDTADLFQETLGITCTKPELELIRRLAELIGTRAARLTACGVSAICKHKKWSEVHVGADGSVFSKYPHFKIRQAQALKEIMDWPAKYGKGKNDPIEVLPAEDGSGVGAALIAALTVKRAQQGQLAGIRDQDALLAMGKTSKK
ncbi:hexokinase-domain-containing protein [Bipolaris maydis]|nr:hexokinase-domain-containing protein [Bipolaris maydis]